MITLYGGTSSTLLAKKVAKLLETRLGRSEIKVFDNSEVRVRVLGDLQNKTVAIIQTTSNPTNSSLMELFFTCDALKRGNAKKIVGVIPYFGYARQNIQHRPGEAVSVNLVVRFLETAGFDEVFTFDLHDEATAGVFTIPFKNLSALPLLAESIRNHLGEGKTSKEHVAIASPDQGGVERGRLFGKAFFDDEDFPLVIVEKKRDLNLIHQSKIVDMYGEVKGKTVILVDDIVTSGGTLLNAAKLCLRKGAKNVIAAIVHPDFSEKAPKRIQNSSLSAFFTTDTIDPLPSRRFKKLKVVSIAPLIAEELGRVK